MKKSLDEDIKEYYALKSHYDQISGRLNTLNTRIKKKLVKLAAAGESEVTFRENIDYHTSGLDVQLRCKKKEPVPTQLEVDQLFTEKGIFDLYYQKHIPIDWVESAYLNGHLGEDDLKSLKKKTQYELALHITKADQDV